MLNAVGALEYLLGSSWIVFIWGSIIYLFANGFENIALYLFIMKNLYFSWFLIFLTTWITHIKRMIHLRVRSCAMLWIIYNYLVYFEWKLPDGFGEFEVGVALIFPLMGTGFKSTRLLFDSSVRRMISFSDFLNEKNSWFYGTGALFLSDFTF